MDLYDGTLYAVTEKASFAEWLRTPVWVPPIALTTNFLLCGTGPCACVRVYVGEVKAENPVAPVTGEEGENGILDPQRTTLSGIEASQTRG
jgi:hypothetical protein